MPLLYLAAFRAVREQSFRNVPCNKQHATHSSTFDVKRQAFNKVWPTVRPPHPPVTIIKYSQLPNST
jgi:hypothetical protein